MRVTPTISWLVLVLGVLPRLSWAQGSGEKPTLDAASAEALEETQALLKSEAAREAVVRRNPRARAADAQARELARTPENTQALYELAADIFKSLVEANGGDAKAMATFLDEAKSHPELLADKLTPEQRDKLKKLARELEKGDSGAAVKQPQPAGE